MKKVQWDTIEPQVRAARCDADVLVALGMPFPREESASAPVIEFPNGLTMSLYYKAYSEFPIEICIRDENGRALVSKKLTDVLFDAQRPHGGPLGHARAGMLTHIMRATADLTVLEAYTDTNQHDAEVLEMERQLAEAEAMGKGIRTQAAAVPATTIQKGSDQQGMAASEGRDGPVVDGR